MFPRSRCARPTTTWGERISAGTSPSKICLFFLPHTQQEEETTTTTTTTPPLHIHEKHLFDSQASPSVDSEHTQWPHISPPPPPVPTMKDFLRLRREQMKPTFVPSETENVIFLFISPFSVCLFLLPTSSDCLLASFPFLFSSHPALHICPFRLCLLTLTTSLCPLIAFRSVSSGRTEQKT